MKRISDRLVVDAIRRASLTLTHRPSSVKYPPHYFNTEEMQSSSSSEDEKKSENVDKTEKVVKIGT